MALPKIIGYDTIRENNTWDDIINRYTCGVDGYVHVWQDPHIATVVWFTTTCPIDGAKATLTVQISNFVGFFYNYAVDTDTHLRIVSIEEAVAEWSRRWLTSTQTASVAAFLSNDLLLYPLIQAEILAQGAAAS